MIYSNSYAITNGYTMNSKNRVCLKKLAAINVDAQFCQLYGSKIFNHQNENDGEYEQICADYKDTLGDLVNNLKFLQSEIVTAFPQAEVS